ncbi:glycerol-3-phosphate 1-O-acyltransferase PlsY [soil metagenome]
MATLGLILLFSYVLGAIPFALVAGRMCGVNLREHGSGNIGATNVYRVIGPQVGLAVFALDFLKGIAAVWLARMIWIGDPMALNLPAVMVLAGAAATLGHIFTVFASFKGGKGVATGAGILVALVPGAVAAAAVIFFLVIAFTRYVSLASMTAAMAIPLSLVVGRHVLGEHIAQIVFWFCAVIPLLIVYTHRSNLQRLLRGTEVRIGRDDPEVAARKQRRLP